ncbi:hypothetical protein LO763_04890 [Glycomyces sp. A-F 0318]|uniref:hypothetical protein n=1 Tax=Glycomyces amatae TaxID=2881355 RepID=UPI001E3F3705|nr:hypothetical protein [Glycomyces amatae]MCD0442961.1 hypothetical protein [Glycomyces amatae]
MDDAHPLVREVYPDLVDELVRLLEAAGERWLAVAARDLRLVAACECGDGYCQSLRTSEHPPGAPYGPGHRNVVLAPGEGDLILDVVDEEIVYVEILDRPAMPRRDRPGS